MHNVLCEHFLVYFFMIIDFSKYESPCPCRYLLLLRLSLHHELLKRNQNVKWFYVLFFLKMYSISFSTEVRKGACSVVLVNCTCIVLNILRIIMHFTRKYMSRSRNQVYFIHITFAHLFANMRNSLKGTLSCCYSSCLDIYNKWYDSYIFCKTGVSLLEFLLSR